MGRAVGSGEVRWSVMIPAYQPTSHLAETLESVRVAIERAGGDFQVEIVDDASPSVDVEHFARGAGMEAGYHRRTSNGGIGVCWNDCVARARGRLVHLLHQDDVVLPDFYAEMERAEAAFPSAGMLFCRTICRRGEATAAEPSEQEHTGPIEGWLDKIAAGQRILCPSVVVRREIYQRLGGYATRLKFVIDWEMWVRIAAHATVVHLPLPLVEYRVHDKSETARLKSQGCITDDLAVAYRVISQTLSGASQVANRHRALMFLVWCSWDAASGAEQAGNLVAAKREARSAVRHWLFAMRPKQTWRAVKLLLRNGAARRLSHG